MPIRQLPEQPAVPGQADEQRQMAHPEGGGFDRERGGSLAAGHGLRTLY